MENKTERARQARWRRQRWIACVLAMTVLPLIVFGACFALATSNDSTILSFAVPSALGIGLVAVWQCPIVWWGKLVGSFAYLLVTIPLLFVLAVSLACGLYGACL